jgi:hypothetical protein
MDQMTGDAYLDQDLPGFIVNRVPEGWHVSASTSTALLISPDGSMHNNPNSFVGKLAVLTASADQDGLGDGDPVSVNGQPARVSRWPELLMLRYDRAHGFGVVVQAPTSLGWSNPEIVDFAEQVRVTPDALQGRG